MKYDPHDPASRDQLAEKLVQKLLDCGFSEEAQNPEECYERVFSRQVADKLRIVVYTSISAGGTTREVGKDSIRVCGVYKARDGQDRGVASVKRVHRVGKIVDIVERMYQRMREVWKSTATAEQCHCGAPKCTSKKGNLFCADICWKTLEELRADNRRRRLRYEQEMRQADYWRRRNAGRVRRKKRTKTKPEPQPQIDLTWDESLTG